MRSIDDNCKHERVKSGGWQEPDLFFGNCYDCKDQVPITDKYRHINGGVYELIPPAELRLNAKECRE